MPTPPTHNWRSTATSLLIAAATLPAAVLLHEAGHVLGYLWSGLPNPTLHYASSGFTGQREMWQLLHEGDRAGAAQIGSIAGAGYATLAAVMISYIGAWIGLFLFWKKIGGIAAPAFAFASALRFFLIAMAYAVGNPEGTDEAHIEVALCPPGVVLMGFGLLFGVSTLVAMWQLGPDDRRGATFATAIGGVFLGLVVWMSFLGPLLLP